MTAPAQMTLLEYRGWFLAQPLHRRLWLRLRMRYAHRIRRSWLRAERRVWLATLPDARLRLAARLLYGGPCRRASPRPKWRVKASRIIAFGFGNRPIHPCDAGAGA